MQDIEAGRILMGDSLGFHILFALLGVGLPLCFSVMEFMGIRRKDKALRENARLWSYVAAVLVITGVISGTVVALQMFLIWPGILDFGGQVIGLGFSLEGYAFIFEAVFLAFYLKTWNSLKGYAHWLLSLPIVLGAALSAYLITSVDAFMNHPVGFEIVNGQLVNPRPTEALFSQTAFLQGAHSILGYYLTTALVVVAAYAWMLWRHKKAKIGSTNTAKLLISRFAIISLVLIGLVAVFGEVSGKYLAKHEPTKLAALELLGETRSEAPWVMGGKLEEDGSVHGGIQIPGALSFLANEDTGAVVQGLDQTPRHLWPPLVIHTLFDIKLVLVGVLSLLVAVFAWLRLRNYPAAFGRPMLLALVTAPFLSAVIIELGWVMTELGRQPYAVYGHLLTKDAMTTNAGVYELGWIFPVAFLVLLAVTIPAVLLTVRRFKSDGGKR